MPQHRTFDPNDSQVEHLQHREQYRLRQATQHAILNRKATEQVAEQVAYLKHRELQAVHGGRVMLKPCYTVGR